MAPSRRRARSKVEIMKLTERPMNLQVSKRAGRFRVDDDYYLIDKMDYEIVQAEEERTPFGLFL